MRNASCVTHGRFVPAWATRVHESLCPFVNLLYGLVRRIGSEAAADVFGRFDSSQSSDARPLEHRVLFPGLTLVWRGAMLALGIAAILPASAGDVRSHAHPATGYGDAMLRARTWMATDSAIAAPGGETLLLSHGARRPRAVVLFHGFTDSPRQFAALADSRYARGDNVFVPRLPHHAERGKDVGELARLTASGLCRTADASVDSATGLGDSVVVLGLSVGGTMAGWAAERRPEVRRAVLVAPAFEVAHVPSLLERPLVNLGAHVPNLTRRAPGDSARPDRDPGFATHGLAQVLRLGMAVRRDAERHAPPRADVLF